MSTVVLNQNIIKSYDGTNLYYVKNKAENENGIVIIIHGLAEHLERYDYVTEKLVEANLTVYRFDNRGHGKSGGIKAHINDYNDFILDADIIVELVKKENSNVPIFMLGHSMGGFITASYGIKYKNKINGQILSGAATIHPKQVQGINGKILKIANLLIPKLKLKNDLADVICRDEKVVKSYKSDELVLKKITAKFYYEFLIKGIAWLKNNFNSYEYPCLVLHGENDKIVNCNASKNFIDNISSSDKELKIYNGLFHEIMNEKERDIVISDIITWIYKRI